MLQTLKEMSRYSLRKFQKKLAGLGFEPGPIDGLWGPRTEAASVKWLEMGGDSPDYVETDQKFSEVFRPTLDRSTAYNERLGVVFHHTAGASVTGDINWILTSPKFKAGKRIYGSYHCLIEPNGNRISFVSDLHRAYHAGISSFKNLRNCNSFMLGVAFHGDTYKRDLSDQEIASALEWLESRWIVNNWTLDWMTDHRTVAPTRKNDLCPKQWARLKLAIKNHFQ